MKKKSFSLLVTILLICVTTIILTGCSNTQLKSPEDIIKDAYGNQEFKISFSKDTLAEPISDLKYTANNIPKLPTPIKIGYIFEGWFFDKNYIEPYSNDALLMQMKNVILYAKWSKEDFTQDGIYDIKIKTNILNETIRKGENTDKYGGFSDFTKCIIQNETYIEKTNNQILLRLQYDAQFIEPYTERPAFIINMDSRSSTDIKIDRSRTIDSFTDTIKTIYIDITKIDLTESIFLNISWINWEVVGLEKQERETTTTTYTVEIKIEKLLGFSQSFVNPNQQLEDGYYLAKTYYRSMNNQLNMGSDFNPVYSYISAKDGNYTLIKPFIPYAGLVKYDPSNSGGAITNEDYFNRLMTYMSVQLCVPIDFEGYGDEVVESDYYPATYNAGKYKTLAYEFHKDTGKTYAIIDLGNNVKQNFMVVGATSGFMEAMMGMGQIPQIMTIDYNHIIKLAEVDYKPLEGDVYQFENEMKYYPGKAEDLNDKNIAYEAHQSNSLINMVHFFYTSSNKYDSRITVTPTKQTLHKNVADSRYEIATFNVNNLVYNYDIYQNKTLKTDSMLVESFGETGLRQNAIHKNGKTLNYGTTIWLDALYKEKVNNNSDFSNVTYQAYKIKNGNPDFSKPVNVKKSFEFNEDIAIAFTETKSINNALGNKQQLNTTSLVYLTKYEEPKIYVSNYDENAKYKIGDTIDIPRVNYSWNGIVDNYFKNYYGSDEDEEINPIKVRCYEINDTGAYILKGLGSGTSTIKLKTRKVVIQYILYNIYGETYNYFITFNVAENTDIIKNAYEIISTDGVVQDRVEKGQITFDDDNIRKPLTRSSSEIIPYIKDIKCFDYLLNIKNESINLLPDSYIIYKRNNTISKNVDSSITKQDLASQIISDVGSIDYAYIEIKYKNNKDTFTRGILTNVTINGNSSLKLFNYNTYFTDKEYYINKPILIGLDGTKLDEGKLSTSSNNTGKITMEEQNKQIKIIFSNQAKYTFSVYYNILYDQNGRYLFKDLKQGLWMFTGEQILTESSQGDIVINFITDSEHTFIGGATIKTIKYNINDNMLTPNSSEFVGNMKDILYGWRINEDITAENPSVIKAGYSINDFIDKYNSKEINLYALWDKGAYITAKFLYNDGTNTVEEIATRKYFLNTTGINEGYYNLKIDDFSIVVPEGYVIDCYKGGILTREYPKDTNEITRIKESGDFFVVLKKEITIKFNVNEELSNKRLPYEVVVDGNKIKNPSAKLNVVPYDKNHTFKYWAVMDSEGNMIEFDITNTKVTLLKYQTYGDGKFLNLYAVFDDGTGKEIW